MCKNEMKPDKDMQLHLALINLTFSGHSWKVNFEMYSYGAITWRPSECGSN